MMWPFRKRTVRFTLPHPLVWEGSTAEQAAAKLTLEELEALHSWVASPTLWPGVKCWKALDEERGARWRGRSAWWWGAQEGPRADHGPFTRVVEGGARGSRNGDGTLRPGTWMDGY